MADANDDRVRILKRGAGSGVRPISRICFLSYELESSGVRVLFGSEVIEAVANVNACQSAAYIGDNREAERIAEERLMIMPREVGFDLDVLDLCRRATDEDVKRIMHVPFAKNHDRSVN